MSDSEYAEKVCKHRKVYLGGEKCIYMSHGEVDVVGLMDVFWSDKPFYNELVVGYNAVYKRRAKNPFMIHGCVDGTKHVFIRYPLVETLEKIFRAAKVDKQELFDTIATSRWLMLSEEIKRNKVLCNYDYVKSRIDSVARDLKGADLDGFVFWNPDYKYVANAIVNLHKKRKISKHEENDDE
jgi:hypothetical protein